MEIEPEGDYTKVREQLIATSDKSFSLDVDPQHQSDLFNVLNDRYSNEMCALKSKGQKDLYTRMKLACAIKRRHFLDEDCLHDLHKSKEDGSVQEIKPKGSTTSVVGRSLNYGIMFTMNKEIDKSEIDIPSRVFFEQVKSWQDSEKLLKKDLKKDSEEYQKRKFLMAFLEKSLLPSGFLIFKNIEDWIEKSESERVSFVRPEFEIAKQYAVMLNSSTREKEMKYINGRKTGTRPDLILSCEDEEPKKSGNNIIIEAKRGTIKYCYDALKEHRQVFSPKPKEKKNRNEGGTSEETYNGVLNIEGERLIRQCFIYSSDHSSDEIILTDARRYILIKFHAPILNDSNANGYFVDIVDKDTTIRALNVPISIFYLDSWQEMKQLDYCSPVSLMLSRLTLFQLKWNSLGTTDEQEYQKTAVALRKRNIMEIRECVDKLGGSIESSNTDTGTEAKHNNDGDGSKHGDNNEDDNDKNDNSEPRKMRTRADSKRPYSSSNSGTHKRSHYEASDQLRNSFTPAQNIRLYSSTPSKDESRLQPLRIGDGYTTQIYKVTKDNFQSLFNNRKFPKFPSEQLVLKAYDFFALQEFYESNSYDFYEFRNSQDYFEYILSTFCEPEIEANLRILNHNKKNMKKNGVIIQSPTLICYGEIEVHYFDRSVPEFVYNVIGDYLLFPYVENHPSKLSEFTICSGFIQLQELANIGIYHQDIKPSNFAIHADGSSIILDYSHFQFFEETNEKLREKYTFSMIESFCEMIKGYSKKHDVPLEEGVKKLVSFYVSV